MTFKRVNLKRSNKFLSQPLSSNKPNLVLMVSLLNNCRVLMIIGYSEIISAHLLTKVPRYATDTYYLLKVQKIILNVFFVY